MQASSRHHDGAAMRATASRAAARLQPRRARTCVGCGARAARPHPRTPHAGVGGTPAPGLAFELVRFVLRPTGEGVAVDLEGRAAGRGAWVHPRQRCLESAAKRGFSRSLRRKLRLQAADLARQIARHAGALAMRRSGRAKNAVVGARPAGGLPADPLRDAILLSEAMTTMLEALVASDDQLKQ